jgi:hypothetical protein
MNFTEEQFARWASSPSDTEKTRMENAEAAVRKAIGACDKLKSRDILVFAQGSYRNRVNVRQDSDVDVAVLCRDTFLWDGPQTNSTLDALGYADSPYRFAQFKSEVGEALRDYFADGIVTEGDKAFDIKATSHRVEADVAPFFEHRRFDENGGYELGVEMRPGSGGKIINWPDQHYANGVAKNTATNRSFKGCVRILKTLRYRMIEANVPSAKAATSFLAECLIWNVPNDEFGWSTWHQELRFCLAYLFNNTRSFEDCGEWGEVSELKYLYSKGQPWTWQGAHKFISDCWDFVGYE